jgi:HEPN domain-containing protein
MGKTMKAKNPTIESVEEYISYLQNTVKKASELFKMRPSNVPLLKKLSKEEYDIREKKVKYWDFIHSADYHYFISRLLFLHRIHEYSYFCGFQCIENYLKAFLKFKGESVPQKHSLDELILRCRNSEPCVDSFINSDSILIIIEKYKSFYELARYPFQHERPDGSHAFMYPFDLYILDYFVMKMREILPIPDNWDILKDNDYYLWQCREDFPDFYKIFYADNINFLNRDQNSKENPDSITLSE